MGAGNPYILRRNKTAFVLILLHMPRLGKYLFEHVYFDWRFHNYLPSTVLSPKNQTKHPLAMGVEQAEHFEMATKVSNRGFSCDVRRSRDFLVYSILEVKPLVPGHFRNADHSC